MKLMRIFVIGLMIIARPAVAAEQEEMPLHVDVFAEPGQEPERALSPSPKRSESRLDLGVLDMDDGSIGTTAIFAGPGAEDQLQVLVNEYVQAGDIKALEKLRDTSKAKPENIRKIIEAGLKEAKDQDDEVFNIWFHDSQDDSEELERELPAIMNHSDATRVQRVRDQLALLAQAAPSASESDITKTVELRPAVLAGGQLYTSGPLAASQVPLPESPRARERADSASSSALVVATDSELPLPSPVAARAAEQAQAPHSAVSAKHAVASKPIKLERQEGRKDLTLDDLPGVAQPGVAQPPKSRWSRVAWFGAGAGILAVAAAAIYYLWINPHYQIIKK